MASKRTLLAACAALLLAGGTAFAQAPQGSLTTLSPADSWGAVSGKTVVLEGRGSQGPYRALIYVGQDGQGWQASDPLPGNNGAPERSRITASYMSQAGGWCRIRTREVTQMPARVSLTWACNEVARDAAGQLWLLSARHREGAAPLRVVSVQPGDQIPAAVKAEWEREVRARFGGSIPTWTSPESSPPPRG